MCHYDRTYVFEGIDINKTITTSESINCNY